MATFRITPKGHQLIEHANKQGGIYPNHIYLLARIRDGKWYHHEDLKKQTGIVDWDEVYEVLCRNGAIETAVGA